MFFTAVTTVRAAARLLSVFLVALSVLASAVWAQAATAGPDDPVIAKVNGDPIYLSDLKSAAESLPASARNMPPQTLYPMLLDQLIDGRALVLEARKTGLDKDPAVRRQVAAAEDRTLETALLHKAVGPLITEDAVRARYEKEIAGKPGDTEIHARHILVGDEATAIKIIAELKKGADFTALSKEYSTDPGAKQQGGDLGYFKKDDMVPEFADAAFALKDGEVAPAPVHTQFGWHVIQVLGRRMAQAQPFEQARDELRQKMIQENVQKTITEARAEVTVEKFNLDGSPPRAMDMAEPPPAK